MAQRYREEVTGFIDALNDEKHRPEAARLIRSLIKEIVITPQNDSKRVIVDIHGDLAGILNMANGKPHAHAHAENELDLKHIQLMVGAGNGGNLNQQDKMAPLCIALSNHVHSSERRLSPHVGGRSRAAYGGVTAISCSV
jgi:hypothetical protein